MSENALRLDLLLWFARLVKTRERAKAIAADGHARIGGRPVARAHAPVRIGDVLSMPLQGRVRIFRVEALPRRRGPAEEARALYRDLSPEALTQAAARD